MFYSKKTSDVFTTSTSRLLSKTTQSTGSSFVCLFQIPSLFSRRRSPVFIIYQPLNTRRFLSETSGKRRRGALQPIGAAISDYLSPSGHTGPPCSLSIRRRRQHILKTNSMKCSRPLERHTLKTERGRKKINTGISQTALKDTQRFFAFARQLKNNDPLLFSLHFYQNGEGGGEITEKKAVFVHNINVVESHLAACLCMKMTSGGALLGTE